MSLSIPPQCFFFYKGNWTPEIDSLLLRTIIRMKNTLNWKGTIIPSHFLVEAEASIHDEIGIQFTWDQLYERLQFLENRYRSFKELVEVRATHWDVHDNTVAADDEVWKSVFKTNKLAGAYYHRGEPEFRNLAILFGPEVVKQEKSNTILVISDTTIPIEVADGHKTSKATTSEEVSSPLVDPSTRIRRRLFDDGSLPLDQESTCEKGHYYNVVGPDGEMKIRHQNVYPPRTREQASKTPRSPHASSCDSSSPSKWWRNPFK